jgi:uncharacterized protein HemY
MRKVPDSDKYCMLAAQAWVELGNWREAEKELAKVSRATRRDPAVLKARCVVYLRGEDWKSLVKIATTLTKMLPKDFESWSYLVHGLDQMGRTENALKVLRSQAHSFVNYAQMRYSLARYACKLGRLNVAALWFEQAFVMSRGGAKAAALKDPYLKPLWKRIRKCKMTVPMF